MALHTITQASSSSSNSPVQKQAHLNTGGIEASKHEPGRGWGQRVGGQGGGGRGWWRALTSQKKPEAMTVGKPNRARAIAAPAQKATNSRVAEGSCQVMQACSLSSCVATSSSRFCRVSASPSRLLYFRLSDATALVLPLTSCMQQHAVSTLKEVACVAGAVYAETEC